MASSLPFCYRLLLKATSSYVCSVHIFDLSVSKTYGKIYGKNTVRRYHDEQFIQTCFLNSCRSFKNVLLFHKNLK